MINKLPNEILEVVNSVLDNKNYFSSKYCASIEADDFYLNYETYARGLHINGKIISNCKGLTKLTLAKFNNSYNICFFFNINGTFESVQLSTDGSARKVPELFYDVKHYSIEYRGEEVQYGNEFIFNLSIIQPDMVDDFEYIYYRILGIKKDTQ
ncbi:hypothetical protein XaC1_325 [Xanthomonas phage XaC1]|nr:hypothetical protein XaC1_325 [Xanthomonas phage XaC1]